MSLEELCQAARDLSISDRMKLMMSVWESLDQQWDPRQDQGLSADILKELQLRVADWQAHPEDQMPWDLFLAMTEAEAE